MSVMDLLQFLVSLGQHRYFTLEVPHLVEHHCSFCLKVDLLLE